MYILKLVLNALDKKIKIKRLEECNMVNDVVESIRDMNLIITESMLDVYDALNDFDNKRQFIYDYENDVEFSDTYLEEFNKTLSDNVVMESATTTPDIPAFDKQRYQAYRFDFIRHRGEEAKTNRRLASLIIATFEASQEAKKQSGESYNTLKNVKIKRDARMQGLVNKLYSGKIEALYVAIKVLEKYGSNESCFAKFKVIPYGIAQQKTGDTSDRFLEVRFDIKLPKTVLTKQNFETLEYIEEINKLKKEQREIIKTSGSHDDRVTSLAEKIADMHEHAPYGFKTTNSDACKNLKKDTCYTDKESDKVLVNYTIGFHCLKKKDTPKAVAEKIDKINSYGSGVSDSKLMDDPNNTAQIIALVKQLGFV